LPAAAAAAAAAASADDGGKHNVSVGVVIGASR